MAKKLKLETRKDILAGLKKIELQKQSKKSPEDAALKKKEKQLLQSKEKYYTHAREYIELWVKTKRAQRGA